MSKLNEATNYFKNRTSFEIPVYDTEQFQTVLGVLQDKDNRIKELEHEVKIGNIARKKLQERIKELEEKLTDYESDLDSLRCTKYKLNAIREIVERPRDWGLWKCINEFKAEIKEVLDKC